MEILGKDNLGTLTSISISDGETFRELDERMKKEHGMRMNFSNLEFEEGVDPEQNVLAYFSRWHVLNENNEHPNGIEKLAAIQLIPQENGFMPEEEQEEEEQEEEPEEDEFEEEDVFHGIMDGIKYEDTIDIKPFHLPGVYQVPIPQQIADQVSPEPVDSTPTLLCRLCAIAGNSMIDLFGPNEPFDNIIEKIEDCLPIVVRRTDTLPKQVCRSCLYKLELCHQFHKTVSEAEKQLTMFDGRIPEIQEQNKKDDNYEVDDIDSTPLSERLKMPKIVAKNPSNVKKLMNYTKEFFATELSYEDEADESASRWSWDNDHEDFETYPVMTSVMLDKQESFFTEFMLTVEGEFDKSTPNPEVSWPKIATGSKSLRPRRRARRQHPRMKSSNTQLFGDKTLLEKSFASEMTQCLICGMSFFTPKQCLRHGRVHYSENHYPCSLCEETFTKEIHCDEHHLEHVGDKKKEFGTKRQPRFGCSECGKKFSNKARLQFHKGFHDPIAVPCHCMKCNRTFSSEGALYGHILTVHTMQKEYFCHLCGQEFSSKIQMNGHKSKHTVIGTKQKLLNENRRKQDIRATIKPVKSTFRCGDCGKTFRRKANLMIHSKIHTGVNPYNCDICGEGCSSKFVRKLHRRSHFPQTFKQQIYKCPYCDKEFTRSFSRNTHVKIHTREVPEPCAICGRQFKLMETMQRHKKLHVITKITDPLAIKQEPEETI